MKSTNEKTRYIISEEKCSEKPFNDWFEVYKAICGLRTDLFVINSHFNQIIKWINDEENHKKSKIDFNKEENIEMLTELLNALKNIFSREQDKEIVKIKNRINDYLPGEIYKDDFMERIKKHVKDTD